MFILVSTSTSYLTFSLLFILWMFLSLITPYWFLQELDQPPSSLTTARKFMYNHILDCFSLHIQFMVKCTTLALFIERMLPLLTVPCGHHWERPEWSISSSSSGLLSPGLNSLSFTQYDPFWLLIPWNWILTHCHVLIQALIVSFEWQHSYLKTRAILRFYTVLGVRSLCIPPYLGSHRQCTTLS